MKIKIVLLPIFYVGDVVALDPSFIRLNMYVCKKKKIVVYIRNAQLSNQFIK